MLCGLGARTHNTVDSKGSTCRPGTRTHPMWTMCSVCQCTCRIFRCTSCTGVYCKPHPDFWHEIQTSALFIKASPKSHQPLLHIFTVLITVNLAIVVYAAPTFFGELLVFNVRLILRKIRYLSIQYCHYSQHCCWCVCVHDGGCAVCSSPCLEWHGNQRRSA